MTRNDQKGVAPVVGEHRVYERQRGGVDPLQIVQEHDQGVLWLVGQLLTESDEALEQWKDRLLKALDGNGQLVVDVLPEIELVIGPQPPVQERAAAEGKNRFTRVFRNFIRAFCQVSRCRSHWRPSSTGGRDDPNGRIPDFPVTRSHPLASWPSAANSSIGRTYRKTVGEESLQRSPVASR